MIRDAMTLQVASRIDEAASIVSVDLVDPAGGDLPPFSPGAHIDVECGPGVVRQYSIFSPPHERRRYRIAVLREDAGRGGSRAFHTIFRPGHAAIVGRPRNQFALSEQAGHHMLFAGGIGITPLLSMAEHLAAEGRSFSLHYFNRTRTRAAFVARLRRPDIAERCSLHFDDELDSPQFDLSTTLGAAPHDAHVYVCGPSGFMKAVLDTAELYLPSHAIHHEAFTAAPAAQSSENHAFEVLLARSGSRHVIPRDRSIASVLLADGVYVPLSCEQGVCGTCITRVLAGRPDHRDSYLSEAEHAANQEMALCCSRACGDSLTLDL